MPFKTGNQDRAASKLGGLTLIRGARQLLTLRGHSGPRRGLDLQELRVIRDGAVLVRNGIIEEVGPTRRLENMISARGAREIDASGRVVMPAFVDSQTSIIPLDPISSERTDESFRHLEGVSSRRLINSAERITHGMARHGTGSIQAYVPTNGGDAAEIKVLRAQKLLDQRPLQIASATFAASPVLRGEPENLGGWVSHLHNKILLEVHQRNLANIAEVRCGPGAFPAKQARLYLNSARELGYLTKVQGAPDGSDDALSLALELRAHSVSHLSLAAFTRLMDFDGSAVMATLLPGLQFEKGEGYEPARGLVNAGCAIALASGSDPVLNPASNMQWIVALAIRNLGLTAEEAICAATLNGACAIGAQRFRGSIEAGKQADIIILNAADYHDVAGQIGVNNVYMTILRGVEIYREGPIRVSEAAPL